jgi:hypothetical protein
MLKIGDLVTATHWKHHNIAIVLDTSRAKEADMGIVRVALIDNPDYEFDQLVQDLEKIA